MARPPILKLFATTAKELEPLLVEELQSLGAQAVRKVRAGASFEGPLDLAYRVCLYSRVASRVLLPLAEFPCPTPEKLYGAVRSIRWLDHFTVKQTFAIDFTISAAQNPKGPSSAITHSHFAALKAKDAIADLFRGVTGERPSVDRLNPDIRVNIRLHEGVATVALDLSGDSLHRRGYRKETGEAPLKENLAAAILIQAGWPAVAEAGGAFVDPMCGTGTLPIEAALIATQTAPGLLRKKFGFQGWAQHDERLWQKIREEALEKRITDKHKTPVIVGYDQDFRAVRAALANVEAAGLRGFVHIEKRELQATEPPPGSRPGIILANPPYGERLGEIEALKEDYGRLGDIYKKRFPGWTGFLFTGQSQLAKEFGLSPSRRFVFYNGAIECRLLRYELYEGTRRAPSSSETPAD